MALGLTNRGSGTHNTGAASFTLSPSGNLAAGSMAVLCVAADNSSSAGSTNDFTTVTDSIGNTWTKRRSPVFDNGAASAGVQGAIFTTNQNVGALQTGTVITVNFGSSPVAKTWTLTEVTKAANAEVAYVTGGDKAAGATGTALTMGASGTIAVGDAILAGFFVEAGTTQTLSAADTDTTNGSWSTNQYNEIGSTTSGSVIVSQGKVQTTTPSAQTYDVTLGLSSDYRGSWIVLHEQHTASVSLTFTGGGVEATVTTTSRSVASALSGGGVLASSVTGAHKPSPTFTGGGVLVATSTGAHATSMTLTGGGALSAVPVAGRLTSTTATGGGAFAFADVAGRQASIAATGSGAVAIDYIAESGENHEVSVVAAGGGVLVPAITTARATVLVSTAGGVVTISTAIDRRVVITASAGGTATITPSSARAQTLEPTGAGASALAVESARTAAAALSGGGVLTAAQLTARLLETAVTGGGHAALDAVAAETHSGSVTASGAGITALMVTSARRAAVPTSASGVVVLVTTSPRSAAVAATGGGRAVIRIDGQRRGFTQVLILGPY